MVNFRTALLREWHAAMAAARHFSFAAPVGAAEKRERERAAHRANPTLLIIEHSGGNTMLRWALAFAILALIAGVLGFGGLAGDFASIAKILLFVFLVLFVVSLIFGRRGPGPVV